MAEPLILDPNEPSGFRPAGGGGGGDGIEILHDPIDMGSYDDVNPYDTRDSRPPLGQRMSSMSIHDDGRRESRSNTRTKRDSVISTTSAEKYRFYRLEKYGDDWEASRRNRLPATQSEMEKLARKWKGSVLQESRAMGNLRAKQLERLIGDVNADEHGPGIWEVAWMESDKVSTRSGVKKCRKMDVILSKSNRTKPRSRSIGGEIIDISEPSKSKFKDKKKDKDYDLDYDGGGKDHRRKDSVLDDPFQESVLFHRTGKPMDDRGPIEFSNAGLPPEIPRDRPIGAMPKKKKDEKEKEGKRGKSKDRGGDDDIVRVDEVEADGPGDSIEAILRGERRSRAGSRGGEPFEPIEAEPGRSRSRRRPSRGGRSRSRPRSQASRPESVRFPPSFHYKGERVPSDAISSGSSGESRYGLDREERSSYTSQDTYHDMTGRGTHYDEGGPRYRRDSKYREKEYYKEHHRGPSMSRSRGASGRGTPAYYPNDRDLEVYERPAYSRRRPSKAYYAEPIPESRQIGYYDDPRPMGPLVRRSTYDAYERGEPPLRTRDVHLHYPSDDMVDLKRRNRERYAEDYQRESVKDEYMDRQERDVTGRERRMDDLEWEKDRRRSARYDDGYGYGGGYHR